MTNTEALEVLRPLQASHTTAHGAVVGFLMQDATRALGGLAQASATLALLLAEDLIASVPVVMGGDVQTLYTLHQATARAPLTLH